MLFRVLEARAHKHLSALLAQVARLMLGAMPFPDRKSSIVRGRGAPYFVLAVAALASGVTTTRNALGSARYCFATRCTSAGVTRWSPVMD